MSNARKDATSEDTLEINGQTLLIKETSKTGKSSAVPVTLVIWIAHDIAGTIAHAPLNLFICEVADNE